jgi:hypothetical protein
MDKILSIVGFISILLFFIGMNKMNYIKSIKTKKFRKILTTTDSEELVNPTPPSVTFDKMFKSPSIWIGDFGGVISKQDYKKTSRA